MIVSLKILKPSSKNTQNNILFLNHLILYKIIQFPFYSVNIISLSGFIYEIFVKTINTYYSVNPTDVNGIY
uniref:Uncharacterized protein n=1 Tax=uncultured marine thaumarchaeote KM3_46_H07 TaxID=1456163 RepID=A0A075H8C9_9ARCH|nr:hypothetical protein [uncultured marine thaumarchaeote KM3_46_H07]